MLLVNQLEPIAAASPDVLQSAKVIATSVDKMLEAKAAELALARESLALTRESLACTREELARTIAGKAETLADKETIYSAHISLKIKELAAYKAQFEPRIMLDIVYDAIPDELKLHKGKWETLLEGVTTTDRKGKVALTPAAMQDLIDLDAEKELATVLGDLEAKGLPSRLSSARHHQGATDLTGEGWRLGVQPSPSLAVALILPANLRKAATRGVCPLHGRVVFLDKRCDESHTLDYAKLRWGRRT